MFCSATAIFCLSSASRTAASVSGEYVAGALELDAALPGRADSGMVGGLILARGAVPGREESNPVTRRDV